MVQLTTIHSIGIYNVRDCHQVVGLKKRMPLNLKFKTFHFLAYLKRAKTCVTATVCMPDVRVVCITSTERDLRFYDTSANSHTLRLHVRSIPDTVSTMAYHWSQDVAVDSKLMLGDVKGTVRLLEFNATNRGPFRRTGNSMVTTIKFEEITKVFCFLLILSIDLGLIFVCPVKNFIYL